MQIFFLTNIFIFTVTFFSAITTLKMVFEKEMDELTSPFCPPGICEEKRR